MTSSNEILTIVAIVVAIIIGIPSWLTFFQARKTHIIVNSRLTELLELTAKSSRAEGRQEGKAEAEAGESQGNVKNQAHL